jgi:hypothetical protein
MGVSFCMSAHVQKMRRIAQPLNPEASISNLKFSMLTDERIDLRRNLVEVVSFQFIRRYDPQRVGGDNFCLHHANPPSWLVGLQWPAMIEQEWA